MTKFESVVINYIKKHGDVQDVDAVNDLLIDNDNPHVILGRAINAMPGVGKVDPSLQRNEHGAATKDEPDLRVGGSHLAGEHGKDGPAKAESHAKDTPAKSHK